MSDQTIIKEARECLRLASDAESTNRVDALDDLKFAAGDQWPANISASRTLENRPCLTINKTDTFIRQVVNNMRQQRPRMVVHPVDNGADQDIAEVIQGLLRHVEVNSNADLAYDTAADFQVRMGWGFWRVTTRYVDDKSFDQDIYIDPITNPFTVYLDPSDWWNPEWALVTEKMKKTAFEKQYPGKQVDGLNDAGAGDKDYQWSSKEEIRVAEYWKVDRVKDTLCLLSNGQKEFKSQLPKLEIMQAADVRIISERESVRKRVLFYKVSAFEVLEKKEWPGKYIPIIPVEGAKSDIDGQLARFGMTRNLKDPQIMYNFWRTSEAEIVALAPKAPWIIAEGQDEGYEDQWDTANTKSYSRLTYKPKTFDDGTAVPPPQRQQPQQIPAASVHAAMAASEDMKAVSGIFDPSLGDEGNEESGKAIKARQNQSDISNFHFYDNLTRSQRYTGVVVLDLAPHIWDTERAMRIIGEDGNAETVKINEKKRNQEGVIEKVLNDVTVGTYDIVMDTGPGYQTKRLEAAEHMKDYAKAYPILMEKAGDIIFRHMDWPGAREIADRLAPMSPEGLEESIKDMPKEAQAMITQLHQQMQQMQQKLQESEMEKKYRIDAIKIKEQGENEREAARLHVKTHDIETITATRRHDVETKALSAQNVAEIKALVELMSKHLDGTHLEKQIEAQDRQLEAKSNETERV